MQKYPSLKARSVIITGAGRGLGKEMALALAEAGAYVMATAAHSADELASLKQEAGSAGRIETMLADAANYADCEKVVAATLKAFGSVHCLVNNAGRGMRLVSETFTTKPCLFWETPPEHWKTIIECNINGPFNMARAVTPYLVKQGAGKIINISTSLQTMRRTGYSPYGPSKAALEAASRVWAADLAGTGVTVNVFLPGGATDTALLPDMANKRGADGQLLSPRLMRAPVLWLCADDSNNHNAERYIAKNWSLDTGPVAAANAARDTTG
jgi:NAD(P)-dependent dehydrogenase (short-subunit alcohol dehydrogenase family)